MASSAYRLSLHLDRTDGVYRAGEQVVGRLDIEIHEPIRCSGLHAYASWQTGGWGDVVEGNRTRRVLHAGWWEPGEAHSFPFELQLPDWPVSYEGQRFNVVYTVGVDLALGDGRSDRAEAVIQVGPGPGTLARVAREVPAHKGATDHMAGGLCCSSFLFGLSAILVTSGLAGEEPAAALGALACLGLATAGTVFSLRNYLAESRIGAVFVGLAPVAHAGRELPCLVRFQTRGEAKINSIEAELVAVETAVFSGESETKTERNAVFQQVLVLAGPRTLGAGQGVEVEEAFDLAETVAPTLELGKNKVEWKLSLRIDIDGWPDWVHDYPILVTPPSAITVRSKTKVRLSARVQLGQVCPYCRDAVSSSEPDRLVTCAGCRTIYHKACVREFGTCATRGCRSGRMRA